MSALEMFSRLWRVICAGLYRGAGGWLAVTAWNIATGQWYFVPSFSILGVIMLVDLMARANREPSSPMQQLVYFWECVLMYCIALLAMIVIEGMN